MSLGFGDFRLWTIDAHKGGGGEGVRSEEISHKNAIKHKKATTPLRFSDNLKYPPQKNLAKTPRTPLDFQLPCIYALGFSAFKPKPFSAILST
jgi:hypothetical protein